MYRYSRITAECRPLFNHACRSTLKGHSSLWRMVRPPAFQRGWRARFRACAGAWQPEHGQKEWSGPGCTGQQGATPGGPGRQGAAGINFPATGFGKVRPKTARTLTVL